MKKLGFIFIIFFTLYTNSQAQNRTCGTMHHLQKQLQKDQNLAKNMADLELQTADFVSKYNDKKTRAIKMIPVVVHVLHNGQAVGVGANISVAQIQSQIEALNLDFRKRDPDTLLSSHPFYSVTADCEIEFCLASLDANNAPTSGITRYDINQNSISDDDMDNNVKPQTIWDATKYLNIWVCNITSGSPILGYASFPGGAANTDGVVILTTAFGYVGNISAPYDNGRTAVHEVGHWLNLRHIWGDGTCATDFVADTKPAEDANYGCPNFPHKPNVCVGTDGNGEMYMNYMDYVNDACMKMFTKGQKARMLATLNVARAGLATSKGCGLNVSVKTVINPLQSVSIFPNPVNNMLEIQVPISNNIFDITILNMDGKICKQATRTEAGGVIQLNVQELNAGFYAIKIRNGKNEIVRKMIKK